MVRLENIPAEIRVFILSLNNYILFFSLFIVYFISKFVKHYHAAIS